MAEFLFIRRPLTGRPEVDVRDGVDVLDATQKYVGRCSVGAIREGIDFEVHQLPIKPTRVLHAQYDGSPAAQDTKIVLTETVTETREVDRW